MNSVFSSVYKKIIFYLSDRHRQKYAKTFTIAVFAGESFFYFIFLPLFFLTIGNYLFPESVFSFSGRQLQTLMILSVLIVFYGFLLMGWSIRELWIYGAGSPAAGAPPQKLVTSGPYALSRNPLAIGNLIYYIGILFFVSGSVEICLFTFVFAGISTYFYHKHIEEPVLEKTFGDEYTAYKSKVSGFLPFVENKRTDSKF
ncbi:isoprenylcysteine carboxylmethyltransferase family protein [Methanolapillus ohkumae]|uniref:Isoprenylcysteine carboxylmethyltransferase family protein n=1 Tax=Methanolapillus ohkumae TaxID=3028298 RepID=A0AA96V805_9EURY|nr:hypothetical protein MsAm2_13220 [Methanosarcinaceae archaeon Am2]